MKASFEKINLDYTESFHCGEFIVPRFEAIWHFHPEVEITLIVHSSGTRFVGDNVAPFDDGDLVIMGPNLPHYWHHPKPFGNNSTDMAHAIVIHFREHFMGKDCLILPEMRNVVKLLHAAARGLHVSGETRDRVAMIMHKIPRHDSLYRLSLLLQVLAVLADAPPEHLTPLASPAYAPSLSVSDGERINKVYNHIMAHFNERLTVESVASLIYMSPNAFCRYFKQLTGRTFGTLVNDMRIGHACRMLIDSDEPISLIAEASGFSSLANFNRRFRERVNMTPSAYRKTHRR